MDRTTHISLYKRSLFQQRHSKNVKRQEDRLREKRIIVDSCTRSSPPDISYIFANSAVELFCSVGKVISALSTNENFVQGGQPESMGLDKRNTKPIIQQLPAFAWDVIPDSRYFSRRLRKRRWVVKQLFTTQLLHQ